MFQSLKKILKKPLEKRSIGYMKIQARVAWEKFGAVPPIFTRVEIETVNWCNGICPFCPVNVNADTRKKIKMKEELFLKIISELKNLHFQGSFSLYSNNEPFLDERFERFSKIAREALPNAHISVFTNGTVLSPERFCNVIPYLDQMCIDNYNDKLELIKPVAIINEYIKNHREIREKVIIARRKINEVLSTRGGKSPNNLKRQILDTSCLLPWNQLVIRPDGNVSLCCNDALGENTLGNVADEAIMDVWHSQEYAVYRKKLAMEGRKAIDTCRYCDFCLHEFMRAPVVQN
ncbi:MAG: SPASM domain-containing protein [Holosporales bacterium]|jgi:radical SAM protein with 4Fe4S-binding SPASM domain|nr:SPASM domain-containing protein [Holosporales bacterium]